MPKKRFAILKAVGAWLINLWAVWVVSLIVIVVGLGVYSYLYNSPQFEVRDVEIKDSGRALDRLQKEMEKTIIGTNIFQVNLEFISEKLEREHPEISRAKVIRKLP
ncbi:MAG: FtsQ-type POTRA domain-containing protein, partial [Deltaproteobacteria bacterium]|nr:FtsQ-type POTRA domain-containing protein [Deltaproteobacteria bacterium]